MRTLAERFRYLREAPGDEAPEAGDDIWNVGDEKEKKGDSGEAPGGEEDTDAAPEGGAEGAGGAEDLGGDSGEDDAVGEPEGEAGNPDEEPPSAMVRIEKALKDLKKAGAEFIKQYGAGVNDEKGAAEVRRRMAELVFREDGSDKQAVKTAMRKDPELSSMVNSIVSLKEPVAELSEDADMPPGIEYSVPAPSPSKANVSGLRAGKEPDATWHRPSSHKPVQAKPKYEPPKPHVYDPNVECPVDLDAKKPENDVNKHPSNVNKPCYFGGQNYVVRNGNVYNTQGKLITDSSIRNAVILKCGK